MLEKLAYWCVLLQLPVYIAQKDISGGFHWEQTTKGVIFFWWALFQNLTPLFAGGFSDKFGHKKSIIFAYILIIGGYYLLATQMNFELFLTGIILLGIGSGIFKPSVQGSIAGQLNEKSSSFGWGIYFMLLNVAVFFGPPLSKFLKEISFSMIFWGSISISVLNLLLVMFLPAKNFFNSGIKNSGFMTLKKIFKTLFTPRILWLVLIMSGFSIIYMQFYETLPNFIIDWSDTSGIVKNWNIPEFMLSKSPLGYVISYEWLYNINALIIIIGVSFSSYFLSKYNRNKVLLSGILTATIGLTFCGASTSGLFLIFGIIVYSLGEMITNPKYADILGSMAGESDKGLFMSYLNISLAIGLGFGSLLGSYLYKIWSEKAYLALNYLHDFFPDVQNANSSNALIRLGERTGLNPEELNVFLWNTYSPWRIWVPFLLIGLISVIGMVFYNRKYFNKK